MIRLLFLGSCMVSIQLVKIFDRRNLHCIKAFSVDRRRLPWLFILEDLMMLFFFLVFLFLLAFMGKGGGDSVINGGGLIFDRNSPYYLHASDTPGTVILTKLLIGEENYYTWSRTMRMILVAKRKLGFILGMIRQPEDEKSDEFEAWQTCNALVLSWIYNAVSPDIESTIMYTDSAAVAWKDLEDRYKIEHKTKVKYPVIKFGGRIVYSRTAPEAEKATAEILELIKSNPHSGDELISMGFDIEWKPTFRSGETPRKAAVIQICVSNSHCYVMHIIHCGIPPLLRSLLEDYSFIKVGVGIANDAAKMFKDYNVHIGALEELSGLANLKLGGTAKNWGLGSLTEMLTCKELAKPKKIRLGNWEVNVLSKEQVVYAATDAYVSWYLHQILKSLPDNSCRDEKPDQANGIA